MTQEEYNLQYQQIALNYNLKILKYMIIGTVAICVSLMLPWGCGFLENQAGNALSNVEGWDLSACAESSCGRQTCFEIFRDNERNILGGRSAVDVIIEQLTNAGTNGIDVDTNGVGDGG